MNTAYTMTINGAKKQIEDKGLDIELLVQAPASNTSTITEQGNIMESMIQQGVMPLRWQPKVTIPCFHI